ncbi:centrosomal protein of 135 kDa [Ixodes scapularis]|uniref:centrosomal protein of 135 kDa n=1 Tax=Ixodes scapularis TaxID=6945 RepID=UPI001AD676CC|nr:centrosomal protein of 135 kDa [Ixodes scapularis]
MGHQYESLRNDLVDMGYSETFGAESASLIARLFADVCSYKEQCSDARNKLRAVLQEKQEKDAMAEAYRQANAKAIVEVNALHQNMMYFKEDHLRKVKELEGLLHKAEEHRRKCEFVKVECQKRVSLLEKESQLKSDRILQLQSRASAQAIIHVTEATKAAPSHRAQGMEVTSLLTRQQGSTGGGHATTPRHPRDAREIDVLRLADTRIHQLQDERQQLKESLHQSRATLELLQQRVEARDREIERLSRLLRDGIPYKALSENGRCSCKLQEEPAPDPKVTLPADQAPCPELRKSVAALKPAKHVRKVNFGHLQRKAEPLGKDLKQTKNKRLASSGGEDASCAENAKFREVLEALRLEKRTLQERVQQMASNERELLREMERLCKEQHRDPAPKDPECDGLQALVRSLERERDHYKEELVQLHQTLESGNLRPKNAAPTSTRGISESQQTLPKERRPGPVPTENSSEGPPWLQEEATRLSALVGELSEHRDQLRVERDRQAKQLAALQEEIRKRDREMKNTELTCKATEDHVDNLQGSIRAREQELARLKLRIQELDDDARSAHAEILRLVRENGQLRDNLTLVAKEHQNMAADLDNAVQQREEFKIQIQEYVTEVARVQELLQLKDQERTDLLEQYGSLVAANADLRAQTEQSQAKHSNGRAELRRLQEQTAQYEATTVKQEERLKILEASTSSLEEALQRSDADRQRLREELQRSTELRSKLGEQLKELQKQLVEEQATNHSMSGHLRRLEDDLSLARNEAATARSDASGLESLLSESRERHCHADLSLRQLSVELDAVKEQLRLGAVNREAQAEENNLLRTRLAEFEQTVAQLRQQLVNEQFEREKCQEDFRRWKEQQQGGLRGRLTLHGFAGTLQTKLNFSPENGAQPQ